MYLIFQVDLEETYNKGSNVSIGNMLDVPNIFLGIAVVCVVGYSYNIMLSSYLFNPPEIDTDISVVS